MKRKQLVRDEVTGEWREEWVYQGVGRARPTVRARETDQALVFSGNGKMTACNPVPPQPSGERVYFIEAPNGLIKIGISRNMEQRWKNLNTASPVPLKLLGTIPGSPFIERVLHQRFAADRVRGEWFEASDELRALAAGELVLTTTGFAPPRQNSATLSDPRYPTDSLQQVRLESD